MSHQLTFSDSEFNNKCRKTRKEIFLSRMDEVMPWNQLEAVIEPFYHPKARNESRTYCLQYSPRQLFKEVNKWLSSAGIYVVEGTIVDATIVEAASSTRSKAKARDPELHQTQKGKQWIFGFKAHIRVDTRTGLTHNLSMTAANVHDITEAENLLHGKDTFISADSGYLEKNDNKLAMLFTLTNIL